MDKLESAIGIVREYVLSRANKGQEPPEFEVIPVWYCYILGGWKCLLTTDIKDGMYYEVTFDKERGHAYLDAYKRWENVDIDMGVER